MYLENLRPTDAAKWINYSPDNRYFCINAYACSVKYWMMLERPPNSWSPSQSSLFVVSILAKSENPSLTSRKFTFYLLLSLLSSFFIPKKRTPLSDFFGKALVKCFTIKKMSFSWWLTSIVSCCVTRFNLVSPKSRRKKKMGDYFDFLDRTEFRSQICPPC